MHLNGLHQGYLINGLAIGPRSSAKLLKTVVINLKE